MLVRQEQTDVVSGGLGEGNDFKIAASAKAFDILSSNLYQNKKLAVIREVSCNAADAHRMVGKPLSDIKITLPTWTVPTFSVRDFGPGLSHKSMLHLYTTFFLSDKDKSNYLIGGLGLGSKSPFSVADQFVVTSWHGGITRQYVCFKNAGIPAINLMQEEPSSEPSGIKVEVVVATTRLTDWSNEAASYFRWWPQAPDVGDLPVNPVFDDGNLLLKSETLVGGLPSWAFSRLLSEPKAYMGMVPYSLNFSALPQLPADVSAALSTSGLILVFNIGELEINPSRETLSYNPATCQALCSRLATVYKAARASVDDALVSAPTLYAARCLAFKSREEGGVSLRSLFADTNKNTKFTPSWQGHKVTTQVVESFSGLAGANPQLYSLALPSYRKTWHRSGPLPTNVHGLSHKISKQGNYVLCHVAGPVTAKTYRTIKHYAMTLPPAPPHATNSDLFITLLAGNEFPAVAAALEATGFPPVIRVEDMPAPPKLPVTPGHRGVATKTQCYKISSSGGFDRTEAELDLAGGGYYTPFFEGKPRQTIHTLVHIKWLLSDLKDSKPFIGLSERRLKVQTLQKALIKNGWQLVDHASIASVAPATLRRVARNFALHTAGDHYPTSPPYIPTKWRTLFRTVKPDDGLVLPPEWLGGKALCDAMVETANLRAVWDALPLPLTDDQKKAIVAGKLDADAAYANFRDFYEKHPLLAAIPDYNGLRADDVLAYINR